MTPSLDDLVGAGWVSPVDVHAARAWARVGGESRSEVVVAAALASRAVSSGHVCLDLHTLAEVGVDMIDGDAPPRSFEWPAAPIWREALLSSPLVHAAAQAGSASGEGLRPLVVDAAGRLYLRRYWEHQEGLAAAIRERIAARDALAVDEPLLAAGLDRLFPSDGSEAGSAEPDLQRRAAAGAVRSPFFVISGGPGTGKTSTVVKILALLVEQALGRGGVPPRILLLAPTGKAAAHLQASVAHSVASLDCPPAVRVAIPDEAATVHRALGAGGTPTRYRRDAANPLEADVVLVDEASMVDLALMARLVAALPAAARLILLGDRDQLASVEAGAVLGDIAGAADGGAEAPDERPVIHLVHSHRFDAASALGALVRAVHDGDADAVLDLLDDETQPAVRRIEPDDRSALVAELRAGWAEFAAAKNASDRLAALDRFRVLCAHRHGPSGVGEHNRIVEGLLAERGILAPVGAWYAGRPVMIARNDYAAGLFNGDVGLVAEAPEAGAGEPRADSLRVLFRAPDGAERWLSPRRLGAAETVFAMSVHKSQGSELDAVLVVLPDQPSPIVSRELLYTAVSRARSTVCVRASRDVVREALARRVERTSGLREAIWG